jgi:predicted esterase YcpF (UPF0227 family)
LICHFKSPFYIFIVENSSLDAILLVEKRKRGNDMILNIHGFASHGKNSKSEALRNNGYEVISPTLPVDPKEAIELLEKKMEGVTVIMGTSLGGFYALYLSSKYGIPALLINPSTEPDVTMGAKLGVHTNWKTGETLEWTEDHMNSLAELQNEVDRERTDRLVLLGTEDDVIDPEVTKKNLSPFADFLEYETDHRFSMFEEVLLENKKVKAFLT